MSGVFNLLKRRELRTTVGVWKRVAIVVFFSVVFGFFDVV